MENIFDKIDIQKFYDSLDREDKINVCLYITDNLYDYEEDPTLNQQKNADVIKIIQSDDDVYQIVVDLLTNSDEYIDADEKVEKLVEDYKKLRENKLTRILNGIQD